MKRFLMICAAAMATFASVSAAQEVGDCDWRSSAQNLGEPWTEYSRTFSNGKTRVALLDVGEPAAAAFYLMILSPPYDELGFRQCKIVSHTNGGGFGFLNFQAMRSSYDPARGLTFTLPAEMYIDGINSDKYTLDVTLNQATGVITPRLSR